MQQEKLSSRHTFDRTKPAHVFVTEERFGF